MTLSSRATRGQSHRADEPSELVGRLAEEMIARWHGGDPALAEEYLERHPHLWEHPEAALELIAEELALREEHGRAVSAAELAHRFPRWRRQVETLWQCQHALRGVPESQRAPSPGDELGGFRLVTELGRGVNGRVFLATQSALGGRTVVIKLTPNRGREHLSLARLQHSHIVPLYSAHEFPERGLRGLCLPYFGRSTLASIFQAVAEVPAAGRTGEALCAALRDGERRSPFPLPVSGPAVGLLQRSSYVDAVCRLGVALADALEYAHARGLVHLDVKPSNVLLAADGVPMLLDFHLARPPLSAGDAAPAWLGGTPEYMAPELAEAVEAVRAGRPIPAAVDGRADVYSLGLLLLEALGLGTGADCPGVPTGLRDVLARCTRGDPAGRYASAAQLAADLQRHLADLPLKGVPNRSLVERGQKWRRRHPFALPCLLAAAAVLLGVAGFARHADRQAEQAAANLREGEALAQQGQFAEGLEKLRAGEARLASVPFSRGLGQRFRAARQKVERSQTAAELHRFCERVRPLYAGENVPAATRGAEKQCRELWAQREQIAERLAGQPTAELDRRWRRDLLDLGILTAHLHAAAAPAGKEQAHRTALDILGDAEKLLGSNGALCRERAVHARAIGWHALAEESVRRAESFPPQSPWDHLSLGRTLLAGGDPRPALAEFDRCLELDPGSLWGNHYRGVCLLRLGEVEAAASAFSACVALSPRAGWCFYNRGLAHLESGRLEWARADFNRALALDPGCAEARTALARLDAERP